MRLLLDEQIPASLARALRERGYDVVSVQERPDLRGLEDPALFAAAQVDQRALVTDNVRHFRPEADLALAAGYEHYGLIYLTNKGMPRHRIGVFIREAVQLLDALFQEHPSAEATSLQLFL